MQARHVSDEQLLRAGAANGALSGINPLMMEMVVKMQEAQTNNFQIMMNSHN